MRFQNRSCFGPLHFKACTMVKQRNGRKRAVVTDYSNQLATWSEFELSQLSSLVHEFPPDAFHDQSRRYTKIASKLENKNIRDVAFKVMTLKGVPKAKRTKVSKKVLTIVSSQVVTL